MLNIEKINNKIITKCIDSLPFIHIADPYENNGIRVVLIGITEEQEQDLDNDITLNIETDRDKFEINPSLCYAYGKINLDPNGDELKLIKSFNWFKNLYINITMHGNYDYDTHTVSSDVPGGRWFETCNMEEYLPYLHGCIGKPERIAIFREDISNKIKSSHKRRIVNTLLSESEKERRKELNKYRRIAKRKERISNMKFTLKY